MDKYTYKDIIIDPDDSRVEIGKEYLFGDVPGELLANSNKDKPNCHGVLRYVGKDGEFCPFCVCVDGVNYIDAVCLIHKKEPEKKYVPFDLIKPEVREKLRGKWILRPEGDEEKLIWWFWRDNAGRWYVDEDISAQELLDDWVFFDKTPCGEEMEE